MFCLYISAYANVYFKTRIIKQNIKIVFIAGVPSSQALPAFLITAPPSVCVPDVIGVLAVWIPKKKKLTEEKRASLQEEQNHRAKDGRRSKDFRVLQQQKNKQKKRKVRS